MRILRSVVVMLIGMLTVSCTADRSTSTGATPQARAPTETYEFKGGYPTPATEKDAYDAVDFNRAVSSYRFFYPTVSGSAIFAGNAKVGVQPNKTFVDPSSS